MKKLIIIFISLFYLAGIAEVSFAFHYCGKKMKYVTFYKVEEKASCCAKSKMKHGCCKDKEVKLSIDDQHHAKATLLPTKAFDIVVPFVYSFYSKQHTNAIADVPQQSHSPPLLPDKIRRHILYCTFLI